MEAPRSAYMKALLLRRHNGLVKIITGIRRCGKSYFLFKLFRDVLLSEGVPTDHIIALQLDDIRNRRYRNPEACYEYVLSRLKDQGPYYVLLDEVQMMDNFEEVMNSFLHVPGLDVYVTGSNSKFLSSDVVTEFRGRGDEIRMYPLSFAEFHELSNQPFDECWQKYERYGGLPGLLSMKDERQKEEYLSGLFRNVYLNDVVERQKVRNRDLLDDVVNILASSIGTFTTPAKIANTYGSIKHISTSNKTVSDYIGYLEDAFLIEPAVRYDIKGRRYIGANKKYYFVDTGLRNVRLQFRQMEPTHLMENVIFNELRMRGWHVDVGNINAYTSHGGTETKRSTLEVDFIAGRGNQKVYIQSAYRMDDEEKAMQEKRPLLEIRDSFEKIIVVRDSVLPWRDENGILIMGLQDFLEKWDREK